MYFGALAKEYGFTLDTPIKDLSEEALNAILYGTNGKKLKMKYSRSYGSGTYENAFEGVISNLERRYKETTSSWMRTEIEGSMSNNDCPSCKGLRLKKEVLAVTIGGLNIAQFWRTFYYR
jgi:excinuclease ABC subunit A